MEVEFLTQPNARLGDLIDEGVSAFGAPEEMVIVSAFASLTTVFRLRPKVAAIRQAPGEVRLVLGVDMGGTSKEVLREVESWGTPVTIVKNKKRGITFHPKVYLLRWHDRAEIIVGSNNLTDGGLYTNYEAAIRAVYTLPADAVEFGRALTELDRFLHPTGPTSFPLTHDSLATLLADSTIPSEAEARKARGEAAKRSNQDQQGAAFGYEPVPPAPVLPPELQALLLAAREGIQANFKKALARAKKSAAEIPHGAPIEALPQKPALPAQLDPSAFYMTLVTSRGKTNPTIPGEQRIPLEAIDMAEDFWGWDYEYDTVISPRLGPAAKEERVYRNWRPTWRIWSTDDPTETVLIDVRMYFYKNSSDFRFYSGDLVRMGAEAGDIVRLSRSDAPDAVFECVLARKGTPEFAQWLPLLVNEVHSGNSQRRFGFA